MTQTDSGAVRDGASMAGAVRIGRLGAGAILYDARWADQPDPAWFDESRWPALADATPGIAGRGRVRVVATPAGECVLRAYRRGGLVGRIVTDRYLWLGAERTRCFREWRMLHALRERGLPVPRPVAARYERGVLTCRAWLLTEQLPGVRSLARALADGGPDAPPWREVGACVRRFHDAGACHADLNAHNLQLDAAGRVYLLDFDRGTFRDPAGGWRDANLARLRRSLEKVWPAGARDALDGAWARLRAGYGAA